MSKLPAFQFYPGDWLKDPAIRACSLAERGLCLEIILIMFESPRRGYLLVGDHPPALRELARMVGTSAKQCESLLRGLENKKVFSRDEQGVLFSRRMLRDEEMRQRKKEYGMTGGNPVLMDKHRDNLQDKHKDNTLPTSEKPPSYSSSPSTSISTSDSRIKDFIDWWFQEYQSRFGQKYLVTGKDASTVKRMIGTFDVENLKKYAVGFFGSDDEFVKKAGYTIGVFWSQINKLTSGGKRGGKPGGHDQADRNSKFRAITKTVEL